MKHVDYVNNIIQKGVTKGSYINRPIVNINKPELNLNHRSFFTCSPNNRAHISSFNFYKIDNKYNMMKEKKEDKVENFERGNYL